MDGGLVIKDGTELVFPKGEDPRVFIRSCGVLALDEVCRTVKFQGFLSINGREQKSLTRRWEPAPRLQPI